MTKVTRIRNPILTHPSRLMKPARRPAHGTLDRQAKLSDLTVKRQTTWGMSVYSTIGERWGGTRPYACQWLRLQRQLSEGEGILFGAIKNTYKKSEAAVVVKNLLQEYARDDMFYLNPANSANDVVPIVWEKHPYLFDGRFGRRPALLQNSAFEGFTL